jgi:hypothetical protein
MRLRRALLRLPIPAEGTGPPPGETPHAPAVADVALAGEIAGNSLRAIATAARTSHPMLIHHSGSRQDLHIEALPGRPDATWSSVPAEHRRQPRRIRDRLQPLARPASRDPGQARRAPRPWTGAHTPHASLVRKQHDASGAHTRSSRVVVHNVVICVRMVARSAA